MALSRHGPSSCLLSEGTSFPAAARPASCPRAASGLEQQGLCGDGPARAVLHRWSASHLRLGAPACRRPVHDAELTAHTPAQKSRGSRIVHGEVMAALGNPDMLTRKIKLWDINAHITCRLCEGYLIDATTVTECLHTFCRSCLVKYLEENNTCPTCRIVIHQSHPLQYIGHDRTMQDIVYKLVPGLQEEEMKKQRDFYQKLGMEVPGDVKGELCNVKTHLDPQRNGEVKTEDTTSKETAEEKQEEENDYHRSDEQVSICLECNSSKLRGLKRKWIRCSAQATVLHLKKFIAKKLNLTSFNELDILCNEEILGKDHTLKFVVVTRWRFKKSPLLLHYRPKMDLL
ncbi:hypothetical protein COCON_G00119650 [Conger conger]|uniref:Polycomb group RING finger protein 3 n=2 Tax=Conger conger TaxID=82655 RepID=A0A9Q1DGQ6_CONCO|nr:hypothetical protein COCON_G00119650 [Conger conger]